MNNKRRLTTLLTAAVLTLLSAAASSAQTKAGAVEYKDDEFSGKRKVTLAGQQIAPTLKMSLTTTVTPERQRRRHEVDLEFAEVNFVSTTGEREYGSETEFNFIVDGARVRGGRIKSSPLSDKLAEDGKELALGVIYLSSLEKIALGREVKMKVGENVFQLDKDTIKSIQDFVRAAGRR